MGTQKPSSGAPGNSPLLPPHVPALPEAEALSPDGSDPSSDEQRAPSSICAPKPLQLPNIPQRSPLAPTGRFRNARRYLSEYAKNGNSVYLRKGVGKYIKGLGGKKIATSRMGGSVFTAEALNAALLNLSTDQSFEETHPLYPATIKNQSAQKIIASIIETIRPIDGTQDAEASRTSINKALSEVLEQYPEADLQCLTDEQREFVVEQYLSEDIICRFELDVAESIRIKAPDVLTALIRLKEAHEYIRSSVRSIFANKENDGYSLNQGNFFISTIKKILEDTMYIFEVEA